MPAAYICTAVEFVFSSPSLSQLVLRQRNAILDGSLRKSYVTGAPRTAVAHA